MKKHIALILTLLLTFCFVSCSTKKYEPYTSLISDTANDGYGVDAEIDCWTGLYFEKNNMEDKTCTALGTSYTGSYCKSIVNKYRSYTTDIYYDEEKIEFGLRNDTGELAYINFMNSEFFDTQPYLPDMDNKAEQSVLIAKEIASQYVENIEDYTQIIEEPYTTYEEKDGVNYELIYYIVVFARKIDGYFTSDYISVKVTSKGAVASIMTGDINAFEDVQNDIDVDTETMNQSIFDKIESTYEKLEINVENISIDDQKIAITPNGEICVYSYMKFDIVDKSNSKTETGIAVLTFLGKK